jgi:hypothetical protein
MLLLSLLHRSFFAVDTTPEINFNGSLFIYSFAQQNAISHAPFNTPHPDKLAVYIPIISLYLPKSET